MPRPKQNNRQRKSQAILNVHANQGENSLKNNQEVVSYRIQESPIYGRFLQATRDVPAGQLILEEAPLVVGPSQDSGTICIGCYTHLNNRQCVRCDQCGFPICSLACPGRNKYTGHSAGECSRLARTQVKNIDQSVLKTKIDAIAPLRCLILIHSDRNAWDIINSMESHTDARKKVLPLWSNNQKKVVDVIRIEWKILEFEEELIHHICGVLEVNAFEVGNGLRAIYPTAYLFPHNCIPNTKHTDNAEFFVSFRSTVNVQNNSPFFVTYTYILQGTQQRRKHLKDTKFFDCECQRCGDVTELGTNISALKCNKCTSGLVLMSQPLDIHSDWQCTSKNCSNCLLTSSNVALITENIFNELDQINGNDITAYENFIVNHLKTLHENHYLLLSAKHCLFQLYGKIEGFLINNLTNQQLERKVVICKSVLEAFNKLDPGLSKQRGIIMYEQHAPLMVLLQRSYQEKKSGKNEMKGKLREVVKCLEESVKILEVEPEGSSEKEMAIAAKDALEDIATWRRIINQM